MYVCVCNAVTDSDIRQAVNDGARNIRHLKKMTGCSERCGCCKAQAEEILKQSLNRECRGPVLLPSMQPA
jgi:bacterioferritin-associated ferredoxin